MVVDSEVGEMNRACRNCRGVFLVGTGEAAGVAANGRMGTVFCFRSEGDEIAIVAWRTESVSVKGAPDEHHASWVRKSEVRGVCPWVGGWAVMMKGKGTALSSMIDSPSGIRVRVRVRDVV
jgi:hypothetical protein